MITEFLINWWALLLSILIFIIIGIRVKWNFFPPVPAPGWTYLPEAKVPDDLIPFIDEFLDKNQKKGDRND